MCRSIHVSLASCHRPGCIMPLVVLCGQPSSAKSTVATAIEQRLRSQGHEAILISEDTLHQDKNVAYKGARARMLQSNSEGIPPNISNVFLSHLADSTSEKRLRGGLKATADRSLSKHTTVILDSINAIKGYRYCVQCLRARTDVHLAT